ncbi:hypothetical protein SteCoe_35695 [Stentor coeruleus]|uniref:RING-type domain-containing protein n=1 Tax=Stentor coeruleus TaxID=5963 RepID=A0A1R2ARX8_9CILI|nr:hypothetical protein SteCoe_35695 [Stentor coeruleus]
MEVEGNLEVPKYVNKEVEGNLEVPKGVTKASEGINENSKFGQKTIPINPVLFAASKLQVPPALGNPKNHFLPKGTEIKPQIPNPPSIPQMKLNSMPMSQPQNLSIPKPFAKQNPSEIPIVEQPKPQPSPPSLQDRLIISPYDSNKSPPNLFPSQIKPRGQPSNLTKISHVPESNPVKNPTETPEGTDNPDKIYSIDYSFAKPSYHSLLAITRYLCFKTIPQKIYNHNIMHNTEMHINKEPILKCKKCQHLKLKITLECSHKICMQCLSLAIENYIKKPSSSTFLKASCPICKVNFSINDLKKNLYTSLYDSFSKTYYEQACSRCNLKKNLSQEYFTELSCLHMCGSCYADEIYSGSTKCFCCDLSFENIEITKNRHVTCLVCESKGLIVDGVYRSFHKGHIMCYECLNQSITACKICDENLGRGEKKALSTYINKKCVKCNEGNALAELILRKEYKEEFICTRCSSTYIEQE